jgi:hypothetical protein
MRLRPTLKNGTGDLQIDWPAVGQPKSRQRLFYQGGGELPLLVRRVAKILNLGCEHFGKGRSAFKKIEKIFPQNNL